MYKTYLNPYLCMYMYKVRTYVLFFWGGLFFITSYIIKLHFFFFLGKFFVWLY